MSGVVWAVIYLMAGVATVILTDGIFGGGVSPKGKAMTILLWPIVLLIVMVQ